MALFRLKNGVRSEVDPTHEELNEELVEGFKLGGIDLTDDNTADDLYLYDNSGLDQEFSFDLLVIIVERLLPRVNEIRGV
ncbi:hypothetical protein I315_03861 [Cryptococcus gattii Ru294]|nr:hypothetical protein I315_03861 [Cryptococcus gattii Ru294]